jgi:mannitol-1-phosphate 5-dehydrogenase
MLAVHFGAGNIGRGFIGGLLHDAGYEVCFVDVNTEIVKLLNEKKEYKIVLANQEREEQLITGVSAVNSIANPEKVIEMIAGADLVTTAVGPNILGIISDLVYKGLKKRSEAVEAPLNIIACENMIGGSAFLKEKVYEKAAAEEKAQFDKLFAFPNAAVDRIVPNQTNDDPLMVLVEPFYEWVVDASAMIGDVPNIGGVKFVEDLAPYIERKLYTVNTGHASIAYLGYLNGFHAIDKAVRSEVINQVVSGALKETGEVIIEKYGFDQDDHLDYINKILSRFENPFIIDDVTRVGRSPLRKLGKDDRLFGPALSFFELFKEVPENLTHVIAAALLFDVEEDGEAVELKNKVEASGAANTLSEITGLDKNHPIILQVETVYRKLKGRK